MAMCKLRRDTELESLISPCQQAACVPVSPASAAENTDAYADPTLGLHAVPSLVEFIHLPESFNRRAVGGSLSHVWGEIWAGLAAFGWLGLALVSREGTPVVC